MQPLDLISRQRTYGPLDLLNASHRSRLSQFRADVESITGNRQALSCRICVRCRV
jgi:hypothetical protein